MITFTPFELAILFIVLLIIGILANIAGYGGAIIVIPFLTVVYNLPLKVVIGSSLSAIAIPALIGFVASWRRGEVDFKAGIYMEIPTMFGAIFGAFMVQYLNDELIQAIFGTIALFVALLMLRRTLRVQEAEFVGYQSPFLEKLTKLRPWFIVEQENYSYRLSIPLMLVAGFSIGFLSGLLGVGGGWLKTPFMIFFIGLPPIIASGTALFMLILTSITGGLVHIFYGNWDLNLFLAISISLSFGAFIGDFIKRNIRQFYISIVISLSLSIVASLMLYRSMWS